jgi:hypothetical protein
VRQWVNWEAYLEARGRSCRGRSSVRAGAEEEYAQFTPEFAEAETGVRRGEDRRGGRRGRAAGTAFATHSWRAAAAGHLWGWQITRCLYLLVVLMGASASPAA